MAKFTSENQPENRGRKPGVPNKKTRQIEEVIEYILNSLDDDKLTELLSSVKGEAILALIAKIAPKKTSIQLDDGKLENFRELMGVKPETTEGD